MSIAVSADELRATLEDLYPRPGWKARNLDASTGRVVDLIDYPDKEAFVEIDWEVGCVSAYFNGRLIFDTADDPSNDMPREAAYRAVESAVANYLTERRKADPYYQEQERRRNA